MNTSEDASLQIVARTAGFLYLIVIVAGIYAELFVRQRLVVTKNPAATASNIVAHEQLFRLGFAADLFGILCVVPLILLLYEIFKVVDRRVALLAVFFSLIGSSVQAAALVGHIAALLLAKSGGADAASTALRLQSAGYAVALAFFGGTMLSRGYLIVRSAIVPRILGVFLAIEGVAYLANTFANFLAPAAVRAVFEILMVSGLAEVALCLWLLVRGVDARAYRSARASAES